MKQNNIILSTKTATPITREGAQEFLRKLKDSDFPEALVQEMSPQDVLFAITEADDEQRVDLMVMSTKEQFDAMIDLACWHEYTPLIEKVEEFIAPLVSTGLGGAIRALDKLENEIKTLLFKKHIIVYLREDKDEDAPYVPDTSDLITTADGMYFIEIPFVDDQPDVVKQLVQALLFKPFEEYHAELQCVIHDLPSELEENALRWRRGRLGDLGFGTIEEGMTLLSPVDPLSLRSQLEKALNSNSTPHPLPYSGNIPAVYAGNLSGVKLLDSALEILQSSTNPEFIKRAEQIPAELTAMTNLFLTGIKSPLDNLDDVAKGTRLARDTLALGLNAIVGDSASLGAKAFVHMLPGQFIQGAMGLLVPLKNRAAALLNSNVFNNGQLLDDPHKAALECLTSNIPGWWHILDSSKAESAQFFSPLADDIEPFADLQTVNTASNFISEIEKLEEIFTDKLKWGSTLSLHIQENHTLSSIIFTMLGNAFLGEDIEIVPIHKEDAASFAQAFCDQNRDESILQGVTVIGPLLGIESKGTVIVSKEKEPARRALLRLLSIGRDHLCQDTSDFLLIK